VDDHRRRRDRRRRPARRCLDHRPAPGRHRATRHRSR
jgi:hypothetical protein